MSNQNALKTDWANINLSDETTHELNLIDGLTFGDLLQEISSNIEEINIVTVMAQFQDDLSRRVAEARGIFADNADAIVNAAKAAREGK